MANSKPKCIGCDDPAYIHTTERLDAFYRIVHTQILNYQSSVIGLFPASSTCDSHIGSVRDSIYCAAAIWALSQAYKKIDNDLGRTFELGQCAVKCMRGILFCWMRQSHKVEHFKSEQTPESALHSKFNMSTGETVYHHDEYGHLQIDCVALYLIFLVEMIASGLQIIFTTDEVNFVQNLVFYVERAYRTPDFGMWERGSKYNDGKTELHASSMGMAKAALETVNGFNLYGNEGASWSVIYVDIDAYNRNRTTLDALLPRESNTSNTDASLLPTLGWPAFALHNEALRERTFDKAYRKLKGSYGFKRFLRDGFGTVLEDPKKKYYDPTEIKLYDGIECEWPIFFVYMKITAMFVGGMKENGEIDKCLSRALRKHRQLTIIPKYYYVQHGCTDAERENPGSQQRSPSSDVTKDLFLWGQAVFIILQLLEDKLLSPPDLDPIRRALPAVDRPVQNIRYSSFQGTATDLVIQVVLIAESVRLQQMLATYGLLSQTPHEIEPIQILTPQQLVKMYQTLGQNSKLGLSGRPGRPFGILSTSKLYRVAGVTALCYPLDFEVSDFYMSRDMLLVISNMKNSILFLAKRWRLSGRPTYCVIVREHNIRSPHVKEFLDLLSDIKIGDVGGVKVRLGRLQSFMSSSCVEHLDFVSSANSTVLADEAEWDRFREINATTTFRSLTNIPRITPQTLDPDELNFDVKGHEHKSTEDLINILRYVDSQFVKAQILRILLDRHGNAFCFDESTIDERLAVLSSKASLVQNWHVVRFCSALQKQVVDSLAPNITNVLIRGKLVVLGVFGKEEFVIDKPLAPSMIMSIIYEKVVYPYDVTEAVLQQELILCVGNLVASDPGLFSGILKIKIGGLLKAMRLHLTKTEDKRVVEKMSPSELRAYAKKILQVANESGSTKFKVSPRHTRQLSGALCWVPGGFYDHMWEILKRTPSGIRAGDYYLPQQPTLSDMTLYELNFSLKVESMLSGLKRPAYRQIVVELLLVINKILERNPELVFSDTVDLDQLVQRAFEEFRSDQQREGNWNEKEDTIDRFYDTPPTAAHGTTSYLAKAVLNELLAGTMQDSVKDHQCTIT